MSDLSDKYRSIAIRWEGNVPWMYRDGLGYLTIGIGHLLYKPGQEPRALDQNIKDLWKYDGGPRTLRESPENALAFIQACSGRKPGPQWGPVNHFIQLVDGKTGEVALLNQKPTGVWGINLPGAGKPGWQVMVEEAKEIMRLPYGQADAAGFFRCYNSYEMTDGGVGQLFDRDVDEAVKQLKGMVWERPDPMRRSMDRKVMAYPEFKDFDEFPLAVQVVILDLAFQLGASGVANYGQGEFRKAIGEENWKEAAKLCPQPADTQANRNSWRKQMMDKAAADEESKRMLLK